MTTRHRVLLTIVLVAGMTIGGWVSGRAPAALAQAGNGITEPAAGAVVSGDVALRGIATHPQFRKWQIDLLIGGDEQTPTTIVYTRRNLPEEGRFTTLVSTRYPDGPHTLRLRVVRQDGNYDETFTPIVIDNRATPPKPGSGITRPEANATVEGAVRVIGVADHPQFQKWQLDLLPNGDESRATFIALGERPANGIRLAEIDTTRYADGPYTLRLRVVREGANYDEYFTPIVIDNP